MKRQHLSLSLGSKPRRRKALTYDPVIVSVTPQVFDTEATSVTVTLPARAVGDRMIICLTRSSSSADAIATPSGWTAMASTLLSGTTAGTGNSFTRSYFHDVTSGNLADTTAIFSGGDSVTSLSVVFLVRGHDPQLVPAGLGERNNTGGQTTIDPSTLTPAYGLRRYLWIAYLGTSNQDTALGLTPAVTGFPSGYTGTATHTTTNAAVASGCGQGYGTKKSTASSDDPSAWTYCPAAPAGCRAFAMTIAVAGSA